MREDTALAQDMTSGMRQPRRVLVAEDDAEMRRLLVTQLRLEGIDVQEASDGRALWRQMQRACVEGDGERPDVIVTDVRMPGMSGLEALRRIRTVAPDVPVVVVTGFGSNHTHAEARSLGAAVLDKPFEVDDLLELIERLVDGPRAVTPPVGDASKRRAATTPPSLPWMEDQ